MKTLDDGRDFRAADAYIGKRAVVGRHPLVIGALAAPPPRERVARREEEVDQHGSSPKPELCTAKWVLAGAATIQNCAFQPCKAPRNRPNFRARRCRSATCIARQDGQDRSKRVR